MSTKYHHGYRLAPGTDVLAFTHRLRAVMNPIRDRLDAQLLTHLATNALDAADLAGEPRPEFPLFHAATRWDEAQAKLSPLNRDHDPHRFEASFGQDPQTGRVHVLLYVDRDTYTTAWQALPEVETYPYWDNTDPPEELTAEEWADRGDEWDRVIPRGQPPIEAMLSFTLRGEYDASLPIMVMTSKDPDGPTHRMLVDALPTLEERAQRAARALIRKAPAATDTPTPRLVAGQPGFDRVVAAAADCLDNASDLLAQLCSPDPLQRTVPADRQHTLHEAIAAFIGPAPSADAR